MAKWGSVDYKELLEFQERLEKISKQTDAFFEALGKDIAKRLIAEAVKRTPVGQYPSGSGKVGGTLRRGWSAKDVTITKAGRQWVITIYNRTEYASYVEYGHRQTPGRFVPVLEKRLKAGWVKGRYMLTISEEELERELPAIIEAKVTAWIKECFK